MIKCYEILKTALEILNSAIKMLPAELERCGCVSLVRLIFHTCSILL
jgi:hypothetical protein